MIRSAGLMAARKERAAVCSGWGFGEVMASFIRFVQPFGLSVCWNRGEQARPVGRPHLLGTV